MTEKGHGVEDFPFPGRTLPALFEAAARTYPDRRAVTAPDGELTYRELDARADSVASALRKAGVGPDVVVPLVVDASTDLLVGLLGIVKAGGAYQPIDPDSPAERIRWLIKDSGAPVVLTTSRSAGIASDTDTILLIDEHESVPDTPAGRAPVATDLAYVIHTSGSTGDPKGVLIEHGAVVRLFERTEPWFHFTDNDVWTMFHSVAFDFSVWESWGALLYGGRLVVVPYEISRSPARFRKLVADEGVTVLNQTPSAFRQFIAADRGHPHDDLSALRTVILGGERLDVAMLAPWFARHGDERPRLVNMFGITETTVHASFRPITTADLATPDVSPIGVPLPDLRFHVLDESGAPAAEGELYVTGPGVARGYHRRDDLTAERFVTIAVPRGEPGQQEERAYRSGDRVRRRDDGEYEHLGRTDDQLKVRGFRIEPREIEAVLTGHPEVEGCLVTTRDHGDGDVRLVAYVVPPPGTTADATWWERLRLDVTARVTAALPRHLRPSAYLPVATLPLTRNGKADRSTIRTAALADDITGTRREIALIWQAVLGTAEFDVDDDYFDLGGTSLSLLRMFEGINTRFHTDLDLAVLLDGVTVATLAAEVDRTLRADSPADDSPTTDSATDSSATTKVGRS